MNLKILINRKENGITLIALVITIIVLLILAGIAISMLSGENGILKQAADAKSETERQAKLDNVKLAVTASMINKDKKVDKNLLQEELSKEYKNVKITGDNTLFVEVDGDVFKINQDGTLSENNYEIGQESSSTGKMSINTEKISDLKIEGNGVQNGTPSLDTPVEVESVGDKTKNLVDVKNGLIYHTNAIKPSYTWERTETGFKAEFLMESENHTSHRHGFYIGTTEELAGKTITLSYGEYIGTAPVATIGFFKTSVAGESAKTSDEVTDYSKGCTGSSGMGPAIKTIVNKSLTITIPEITDYEYIYAGFYLNYGAENTQIGDKIEFKNIQVEISDTKTDYEPHGYKIPIEIRGKNMITPIDGEYNKGNVVVDGGNVKILSNLEISVFSITIPCEFKQGVLGKNYTLGWGGEKISDLGQTNIKVTFEDGSAKNLWGNWTKTTFTLSSNISKVELIIAKADTEIIGKTFNIQLEEGDMATAYEPSVEPKIYNIYIDEPLRKIGEYADYIDFEKQEVVRNIENLELKVSDMANNEDYPGWRELTVLKEDFPDENRLLYQVSNGVLNNISSDQIFIGINNRTTGCLWFNKQIVNLKQSEWIANYPNLIFNAQYVKPSPKYETIELPTIETYEGTNIIEVNTEIKPSNISLSYYRVSE